MNVASLYTENFHAFISAFPVPVPGGPVAHPVSYTVGIHTRCFFLGNKADGTWRWSPIPSSAKVKERAEMYLYSLSGPSCIVIGIDFTFYLFCEQPC